MEQFTSEYETAFQYEEEDLDVFQNSDAEEDDEDLSWMDFTNEDHCISMMSKQIPISVTVNWIRSWLQQDHFLDAQARNCLNALAQLLDSWPDQSDESNLVQDRAYCNSMLWACEDVLRDANPEIDALVKLLFGVLQKGIAQRLFRNPESNVVTC